MSVDFEKALEVQKAATRAVAEALAPLVTGDVILAVDVVMLIDVEGRRATSRINLGPNQEHRDAVRDDAKRIYAGEHGPAAVREDGFIPFPSKH